MLHRSSGAWWAAVVAGLFAPSCREATSVEVEVLTDLPCEEAKVVTTSISSGSLDDYERRPPSAVTTRCDAGRIGSLVFVPSEDERAEIAIRVVTARNDRSPDACLSQNAPECIIARRVVRFVPHRTLRLSVRMQQACSGVSCPEGESCLAGACVPAFVAPEELTSEPSEPDGIGDDASAAVPPELPGVDAGVVDAAPAVPPPPPSPPPPPPDAAAPADAGVRDAAAPRDAASARDAGKPEGGKKGKGGKGGKGSNENDDGDD